MTYHQFTELHPDATIREIWGVFPDPDARVVRVDGDSRASAEQEVARLRKAGQTQASLALRFAAEAPDGDVYQYSQWYDNAEDMA